MIIINALQEAGHTVTLATVDRTNWEIVKKRCNLLCEPDEEISIIPNPFETGSNALRVALTSISLVLGPILLKCRRKYDLLINTSGEIFDLKSDIVYINAIPIRMALHYPDVLPTRKTSWLACSRVFDLFSKIVDRMHGNSLLLTNSKFNEEIVSRGLGRNAIVIYPPIDVQRFSRLYSKRRNENLIVVVSRFRPGKNLENVPRIVKRVKNAEFLVIGPRDEASRETIERIGKLASALGVEGRVRLLFNVPASVLSCALSRAKILLHTQPSEAFGMAVVEAMAAGCVPLVPRDGGPWFDILGGKEGVYGFSYASIGEAAQKISVLLQNEELRAEVSARASRRAVDFDVSVFESRISSIVQRVYLSKLSLLD